MTDSWASSRFSEEHRWAEKWKLSGILKSWAMVAPSFSMSGQPLEMILGLQEEETERAKPCLFTCVASTRVFPKTPCKVHHCQEASSRTPCFKLLYTAVALHGIQYRNTFPAGFYERKLPAKTRTLAYSLCQYVSRAYKVWAEGFSTTQRLIAPLEHTSRERRIQKGRRLELCAWSTSSTLSSVPPWLNEIWHIFESSGKGT